MHQITVNNITIDVVRKDIKNLHLGVYPPTGRVRIAAPLKVNDEAVRLFAISKLSWIKKHQRSFNDQERLPERQYISGESHYFKGRRYLLNVIYQDAPARVELKHNKMFLYIRENSTVQQKSVVVLQWYRQQLKQEIPALIEKWEKIMGVQVNSYGIKLMKTKWGTCNREAKRIWLNLELAKKPMHCLEYILVHEMIHLLERHHNDIFLQYLNQYLPNWRQFKEELNRLPINHSSWLY